MLKQSKFFAPGFSEGTEMTMKNWEERAAESSYKSKRQKKWRDWGEEEEGKCGRNMLSRDGCRMGSRRKENKATHSQTHTHIL